MSLIAQYKLDGDATDATGTYNGTATNVTYTTGKQGQAGSFNGSSAYVVLSPFNVAAITVAAWIRATAFTNAYNAIISRVDAGGNNSVQLFVKSNGKLACYVRNGFYDGTGSNTLTTGQWYHLAITLSASSGVKGYVNGSLDGSGSGTTSTATESFNIGRDTNVSGRLFNGLVDDVRFYDTVLTASEVLALYNSYSGSLLLRRRRAA